MIGKNQCEHGSLKRQCLICEYEEQLKAAAALAKASKSFSSRMHEDYKGVLPGEIDNVDEALAAYYKARTGKGE